MIAREYYPFAKTLIQVCRILNIQAERVVRRIGLSADVLENEGRGLTGQQMFCLWTAIEAEADREDLSLFLGQKVARGPINSAIYAFTCSPNTIVGLERLAKFKPLIGPMTLVRHHYDDRIELSVQPGDANMAMPPSMALMDMVLFLELVRCHTGEHVIPLEVRIPRQATGRAHADAYFGVTPQIGKYPTLILSREDAERPLITENPELWSVFETDLHRRIEQRRIENTLERRVRGALQELLPSGQSSIDAVSRKLNMSKRSLQRKLRDEGQTFQTTLDATRSELSMRYLKQGDMTVEEISFLLAYQDPNSFYRAFHTWTGMTPMQARRAG